MWNKWPGLYLIHPCFYFPYDYHTIVQGWGLLHQFFRFFVSFFTFPIYHDSIYLANALFIFDRCPNLRNYLLSVNMIKRANVHFCKIGNIPKGKMSEWSFSSSCPKCLDQVVCHSSDNSYPEVPRDNGHHFQQVQFIDASHRIKIKSPAKSLSNEQYVFVGGNISFLCVLSCSSEGA